MRYRASLILDRSTDIKKISGHAVLAFLERSCVFVKYHLLNHFIVFLNTIEIITQLQVKCLLSRDMPTHKKWLVHSIYIYIYINEISNNNKKSNIHIILFLFPFLLTYKIAHKFLYWELLWQPLKKLAVVASSFCNAHWRDLYQNILLDWTFYVSSS